jgi:hypothetical protein
LISGVSELEIGLIQALDPRTRQLRGLFRTGTGKSAQKV